MKITRRGVLAAISGSVITALADRARAVTSNLIYSITGAAQTITDVNPKSAGFVGGAGSAGRAICTFAATMSPPTPAFSGTWSLGGTDQAKFTLNATTGALSVGASDVANGSYSVIAFATQGGSVFSQPVSIAAASSVIGYSAVITMFGTATYNADGTITGTPNGAVYTFNPDSPDAHTTATNRGNFVSDFAGFTQSSIECIRDDTPVLRGSLRVIFRKDISPDPTRIEIIVECGTPTTNGSAANLGPFSLQIFKGGTPQNIPVYTVSGSGATWVPGGSTFTGFTNVTTAYFPQMGWFTRWRWNPTPRAEVRTRASLLPGNLNLLPNFSASLATQFRAANTGQSGSNAYLIAAYSSANPGIANSGNYNPVGINESCGTATALGGTGDRPELGIIPEWHANYVINGYGPAQSAMYVTPNIHAGMAWCVRDLTTGAPVDFINNPNNYVKGGGGSIDTPTVTVPSTGGNWDIVDLNHLPQYCYLPYILTGDPFYLEQIQFGCNWEIGANSFHRSSGWAVNYADPNSPTAANPGATIPLFPSYRAQTRGLGWAIRDFGMAYLATPATVPGWLISKATYLSVLSQNQTFASNNSGSPDGSGTNHTYVINNTNLAAFGQGPAAGDYEQGFYMAYFLIGAGFAINQCGLSNWLPYYTYAAKLSIGWASGGNGWPQNWPNPYSLRFQALSTDYAGNPSAITSVTDTASNFFGQAYFNNAKSDAWGNNGFPTYPPTGAAWAASTAYHCNSWILEVRSGFPILPNAGDVVSFTISGSFSGSPVTVSRTIISSDVSFLAAISYGTLSGTTPITDALISAINASAAGTAGITAAYAPSGSIGVWFTEQRIGRIYLSFNSGTIGDIVVTGSYTINGSNTASSVFVQPNGDVVHNGVAGANLFARPLSYCAATTKTSGSGGGPTGQALQTPVADGANMKWHYIPETKVPPMFVPATQSILPAVPRLAQVFTELANGPGQPAYAYWALAGLSVAQSAGLTGAAAARTNVLNTVSDWWTNVDTNLTGRFSFSIAP